MFRSHKVRGENDQTPIKFRCAPGIMDEAGPSKLQTLTIREYETKLITYELGQIAFQVQLQQQQQRSPALLLACSFPPSSPIRSFVPWQLITPIDFPTCYEADRCKSPADFSHACCASVGRRRIWPAAYDYGLGPPHDPRHLSRPLSGTFYAHVCDSYRSDSAILRRGSLCFFQLRRKPNVQVYILGAKPQGKFSRPVGHACCGDICHPKRTLIGLVLIFKCFSYLLLIDLSCCCNVLGARSTKIRTDRMRP